MLFSGFFAYQNKKYGNMFVAVQTYTKKIFACPIKNLKIESFMKALETMKKVNDLFFTPSLHNMKIFFFMFRTRILL
jgi:hypothetical protein